MADFSNFQFYNFSGGLDFKHSAPLVSQSEKEVAWADGFNIELLQSGGITRMNGSQLFAAIEGEKILGGFEGENNGKSFLVVVTASGKFYSYENSGFVLKKSDLTPNQIPNFKVYLNGVFVVNGVDDPFLFVPGNSPEISQANATTTGGTNIRSLALEVYKGRIWMANGSTLYYSALGKFDDWQTQNDAGSISNFHNDTSPITALCNFKDVLVIHKKESSFILSGNSPENFVITPFSNLGAISPMGINVANGRQIFFNRAVYPFVINELGEITQGSAISENIKTKLESFNNSKNEKCILLNFKNKSQIWCFLYENNDDYFHTILIYDYFNNAWFQRIVPYDITSAWEYQGGIYCGLRDGKIVKESVGTSFMGAPIEFNWKSPFFHFGKVDKYKTVEHVALILSMDKDNNFNYQTRKNYSNYYIEDKDSFTNIQSNTLVFCDENGKNGQGVLDNYTQKYGFITLEDNMLNKFETLATGSNKSFQIELFGNKLSDCISLLGIEFKEVYFDV